MADNDGASTSDRKTAVVLFTRDLRVHDHPALSAARDHADRVIPLFVLDDAILGRAFAAPNRLAFLADSLGDLRDRLRDLGSDLVIRRGDVVEETLRVAGAAGASAVVCSADVTSYARRREARLAEAGASQGIRFRTYPGVTVVPAGELSPANGDHYRVFTPYWRAWEATGWRETLAAPAPFTQHPGVDPGELPGRALAGEDVSPSLAPGGETQGRRLLDAAVRRSRGGEPDYDDMAGDRTSRLSPHLHFGCLSPLEMAVRLRERAPAQVRQLAWRDFHHQVTAAFPAIAREDYRDRGREWHDDGHAVELWKQGKTGVPVVDAGMRQLLDEGWMHNRARLITASFLTKTLRIDWRIGAEHFFHWLVDGDIANNAGNWQWVAGTGNDTRPNRVLNPLRQAKRFDPDGTYVRRYVPELRDLTGPDVHTPWLSEGRLDGVSAPDYPPPLIDI